MKIEILKDHPSGLVKGQISTPPDYIAKQLIKSGIAKEVKRAIKKNDSKTK